MTAPISTDRDRTRQRHRRALRLAGWTLLVLAAAAPALDAAACPVCFGETDEGITQGIRWSVVFMGALVYLLIGGGLVMFLALRRRARQLQDPHRGLRLVDSGSASR